MTTKSVDRDRLSALDRAVIWAPQPGPQLEAFLSKADQVLFGGAAGGGKTSLGIGLALTAHKRTLFIRREGLQLSPVVDEIAAIVGTRDGYNGADHVWRLAGGRQIQFGGVQDPGDETRFQGNPRDLLVLDEAAYLLESQARFLLAWVRSTDQGQRCRTLLCSNPPTSAEGEWLVRWFAPWLDRGFPKPARPGELRWVAMIPDEGERWVDGPEPFTHKGETIRPVSRTFVPSRVGQNRFLASTGYAVTLGMLPEPLRSQMLLGDFTAGREDASMQVIPSAWIRAAQERWKSRPMPTTPMTAMGVDVARGGRDHTVLTPRYDNWIGEQVVDVIGWGSSAFDNLRERIGSKAVAMNGASGSERRDKSGRLGFANRRAEWYWKAREALDPASGRDLALPPDAGLLADLAAPTWKLTARGIQVESKEDIIKRLGRSPDKGDSLVYALAGASADIAFAYDAGRNAFTNLPVPAELCSSAIGVTFGADDDGIAVLSWTDTSPEAYLVEEWSGPKQGVAEMAARLHRLIAAHNPLAVVVSVSEQLGPAIVSEMCGRYDLALETAEPKERNAAIALVSDALRGERFFARPDGPFALEARRLEFDGGKLSGESPTALAVAAAYSRCYAWLYVPAEPPAPKPGTPEFQAAVAAAQVKMMEDGLKQMVRKNRVELGQGIPGAVDLNDLDPWD